MNPDRYDVRLDCRCSNFLAYMRQERVRFWTNVDPRPQPDPPRFALDERHTWQGHCRKCGYHARITADRLAYFLGKLKAARITHVSLERFQ